MSIDWVATLQEQADFAIQTAKDVNEMLALPDLTLDQASRLYRSVEKAAQAFDRIVEAMDGFDLDDEYTEAAETLEDMWASLSILAVNRLRTMQGLDPIEIAPEEDVGE